MKRCLLALSLSLLGFGGAQDVQVSGAPAVNFNVLPDGAIWIKPGLFKIPNYNGSGLALWIEVSGSSAPLMGQWTALDDLVPVTVGTPVAATTFSPVTVSPAAPAAAQAPVSAQPPVSPAPALQAAPAALTVAAPEKKNSDTPQAAPAAAPQPVAAQTPTPVTATVITTRKDAADLTAASRSLPQTTPTRVALMATDKGTVSGTLPAWLNAQVFVAPGKEPGTLTLGYTFSNTDGTLALITDPTRLTIKQGERLLPGRLDRRNTSQQVGYLGPKTGEFGTVTVSDVAAEPVTFTWNFMGTAGEGEYTLNVTWSLAERAVRSN